MAAHTVRKRIAKDPQTLPTGYGFTKIKFPKPLLTLFMLIMCGKMGSLFSDCFVLKRM